MIRGTLRFVRGAALLGEGDDVAIDWNRLDLDDPEVAADIQALLDRGIELEYESQKDPL